MSDECQPLRVLIVEDSLERLALLRNLYVGHTVSAADTCASAEALLRGETFDLVHLDYDLGQETSVTFARKLASNTAGALVVIHSDNPAGATQLQTLLPDALIVPISILRRSAPELSRLKSALAATGSDFSGVKTAYAQLATRCPNRDFE